jgi:hypothetical protein
LRSSECTHATTEGGLNVSAEKKQKPADELNDAELEAVSGGAGGIVSPPGTTPPILPINPIPPGTGGPKRL